MEIVRKCTICKENKEAKFFRLVKKTQKLFSHCKECENKRDRERYPARREVMLQQKKEQYNPIAKKEYNDNYRIENRDQMVANSREYYYNNQEELKAQKRQYNIDNRDEILRKKSIYQKENPDIINSYVAKRNADKASATPKWLTKEQLLEIRVFYAEATKLTKETGIKHEVDHIIPLRGKNVVGLHVPWNLQILTKIANIKKGNKIL